MDLLDHAQLVEEEDRRRAIVARQEMLRGCGRKNCMACGDPIGTDRLAAMPNAVRCLRCQEGRERWNRRKGQ
ncbi:TraR/DksA C4-type zinc finger protein [Ancylobacter pratisalsi]|nr:TraR/DksA C4-type zinc finger protein [Ancylobacter pratisalsi]